MKDPIKELVYQRFRLFQAQADLAHARKHGGSSLRHKGIWDTPTAEHNVKVGLDHVMTAQIYAHRHLSNALNPWPEKVIIIKQEKV